MYKAAVVGLGNIGLMYDFDEKRKQPAAHVLAYQQNEKIELVAGVDVDSNKKELLLKFASSANYYSDLKQLAVDYNQLDIISICTPVQYHFDNIEFILNNMDVKIIFCEKPLASDEKQAFKLKKMLEEKNVLLVPNISRRWSTGLKKIKDCIEQKQLGDLQSIYVKYTRGVYNTGAHLFDLLNWWAGKMKTVRVVDKVPTSADADKDDSFNFVFELENGVHGFAGAFDDRQYYLFDIDLFFSCGKIEFKNSGNDVFYYNIQEHQLFSGFKALELYRADNNLFDESFLANAIDNLCNFLDEKDKPYCLFDDAIYSLFVASALEKSYVKNSNLEGVESL